MPDQRQSCHLTDRIQQVVPALDVRQFVAQSSPDLVLRMLGKSFGQQQDRRTNAHDHGARNFSALA
jgi:hypothetical protein